LQDLAVGSFTIDIATFSAVAFLAHKNAKSFDFYKALIAP
jgi:hypothetical protein